MNLKIIGFVFLAALGCWISAEENGRPAIPKSALNDFAHILILDEGRVKPLDTFARAKLLQLSSRSSFGNEPAISWLARLLFAPELAMDDKVFRINHPDLVSALGLTEEPRHRYSFHQLENGVQALQGIYEKSAGVEENDKTPLDKEAARLLQNLNTYAELMQALRFSSPHPMFRIEDAGLAKALGLPEAPRTYSFLELRAASKSLQAIVTPLLGRAPVNSIETSALGISKKLQLFSDYYSKLHFPVLPATLDKAEGSTSSEKSLDWVAPWKVITSGQFPELGSSVLALAEMSEAYQNGNAGQFKTASSKVVELQRQMISGYERAVPSPFKQSLEVIYNNAEPFYIAEIFYAFALVAVFISFLFLEKKLGVVLSSLSGFLIIVGWFVHLLGIVARMTLTGRPPITNLYETFLFVSAVTVLLSIFLERMNRRGLGWLSASLTGLVLLLISGRFASDGDTLKVLVAVLDSNFWLSTHVIAINLGYAGAVLSGVIGHIYLFQAVRSGTSDAKLKETFKLVFGVQAFGLLFTFIGTMLGGVWADQSWGRFWGWDPKENGALLIVLWSSILFHARLAGMVRDFGFAAGSVFGIVVVMMAWFGINLLGVGLHSYGFTNGIAYTLFTYVALQCVLLGVFILLFARKQELKSATKGT